MKKYLLVFLFVAIASFIGACPVCDRAQPKITMGLTHGVGPQSSWDWVAIVAMVVITLYVLVRTIFLLVKPKEGSKDHIKQSILSEN